MGGVKTIDMGVHGNKTEVLTQNKNKHMACISKADHDVICITSDTIHSRYI